jgi:hypothetical protein
MQQIAAEKVALRANRGFVPDSAPQLSKATKKRSTPERARTSNLRFRSAKLPFVSALDAIKKPLFVVNQVWLFSRKRSSNQVGGYRFQLCTQLITPEHSVSEVSNNDRKNVLSGRDDVRRILHGASKE